MALLAVDVAQQPPQLRVVLEDLVERERRVAVLVVIKRVDGVVAHESPDREAVLAVVVRVQVLGLVVREAEAAEVGCARRGPVSEVPC